MSFHEFQLPFSEDPQKTSSRCIRCGQAAEIHIVLLGSSNQTRQSGSLCLPCSELVIHSLQAQRTPYVHAPVSSPHHFNHTPVHADDAEHGIIHWEGQGWSSDGPFAGA